MAERLGINEWTYGNWENGENEPSDRLYPAIIEFLGREPWPEPVSLPEQLQAERRRRGLSIDRAAAQMGIDETTLWWWESGRRKPHNLSTRAKVEAFLIRR